jgi:hypothetical protein
MLTFSDFIDFIDSIYFEGYADQLQESDPEKLQFEYAEYQAAKA